MYILAFEEGVGHAQAVQAAKFQKALTVLIYLAPSMSTKARRPGLMVGSHSSIEVA